MLQLVLYYPDFFPPGRAFPSPDDAPEAREHKFVLFRWSDHWLIAIGPALEESPYRHADLLPAVACDYLRHTVRGGGFLRLEPGEGDDAPVARFHGRSGDYGRFDPMLMSAESRLMLTGALGRRIVVS